MQRFLVIYHDSCEHALYDRDSYFRRIHLEELSFHNSATDINVNKKAQEKEEQKELKYMIGTCKQKRSIHKIFEIVKFLLYGNCVLKNLLQKKFKNLLRS